MVFVVLNWISTVFFIETHGNIAYHLPQGPTLPKIHFVSRNTFQSESILITVFQVSFCLFMAEENSLGNGARRTYSLTNKTKTKMVTKWVKCYIGMTVYSGYGMGCVYTLTLVKLRVKFYRRG